MALIKTILDKTPRFGMNCYAAENAVIAGDVTIGDDCSVWFNAVIRGDVNWIHIGSRVNVQDGACLHTLFQKDYGTITIGDDVTIGHNATVHGADIESGALIGMGATLLDGSHIGRGAIVAAGALVLKDCKIGDHELWAGVPAKFIKKVDAAETDSLNKEIASHYPTYASWFVEENPDTLINPRKK